MIELTSGAQRHLEQYLGELRTSLGGCPSVDSFDVERDVMEHIEKSLAEAPAPVDLPTLRDVLQQLGSPAQWIPEEEMSWRRRAIVKVRRFFVHLRSGPEDFRLAYLSIGLLALAAVLFAAEANPAWPLISLGFSFIFARAALAAEPSAEKLGAQRWLLYPVLVIVYLILAPSVLLWTIGPGAALGDYLYDVARVKQVELEGLGRYPVWAAVALVITAGTGLWWVLLGLVTWRRPGWVRNTFYPFAPGFRGRHGLVVASVGLLLVLGAVFVGLTAV